MFRIWSRIIITISIKGHNSVTNKQKMKSNNPNLDLVSINGYSDFIWPFLRPYMGVIPNPKMAFIFPISCILALIFPILIKYFPKCVGKGSFPKSQIKSLGYAKVVEILSICSQDIELKQNSGINQGP